MDTTISSAVYLSVLLEQAQLVASTSQAQRPELHRELVQTEANVGGRSYAGASVWFGGLSVPTAVSESMVVLVGDARPEDAVISQIEELANLTSGWDGEGAPAPDPDTATAAIRFVRAAAPAAGVLEPTIHADGSIILELDSGLAGSIQFNPDGTLSYAIAGFEPATTKFDGKAIPEALKVALNI